MVFLRLVVSVSFSSPVSLLGNIGAPEPVNGAVTYLADQSALTGQPGNQVQTSSGVFSALASAEESVNSLAPTPQASADPMQIWLAVGMTVWLIGIAGLLLYAIVQYFRLHRRVSEAVRSELDVYETDAVTSPFVMGVFRPRIILPVGMSASERRLVLLHERAHIGRLDHVTKPIAFLILTMHWFNPLVWLAFRLLCDDLEASCDERAMKACNRDEIAAYGETLLRLGTQRAAFAAGPLAFGEHCTKERIINVLNYKKPSFWIVIAAVILAVAAAIVLLTNPLIKPRQAVEPTIEELNIPLLSASDFDQASYDVPEDGGFGVGIGTGLYHLGMDSRVLGEKPLSAKTVADFANQLSGGQAYIKAYLKKNAAGCYDEKMANSVVDYNISFDDTYQYYKNSNPPTIQIGKMYWHCAQYYVFLILHPDSLHWQHFGYAEYLGSVLNPYDMWLTRINAMGVTTETMGNYAQVYLDHNGKANNLSSKDYRLLIDAVAYDCLENGMNRGTPYESYPITKIDGFTEPAEQGDDMSVAMASSFCAYLAEHYGFDKLTSYCAGQTDFRGAFGTTFDRAYAKWEKSIVDEFSK